jgi:hypothetical protein
MSDCVCLNLATGCLTKGRWRQGNQLPERCKVEDIMTIGQPTPDLSLSKAVEMVFLPH